MEEMNFWEASETRICLSRRPKGIDHKSLITECWPESDSIHKAVLES